MKGNVNFFEVISIFTALFGDEKQKYQSFENILSEDHFKVVCFDNNECNPIQFVFL